MSARKKPQPGQIAWSDLTVNDAGKLGDFYSQVAGWRPQPVDMGNWNMVASDGEPAAGVCHARGGNADLPPVWLVYITVAGLEESIRRREALGGKVRCAPRGSGFRFGVIEDPAGALVALCQTA
ncbi:MAG: VOC family protein [Terriglobales bacterium]